MNPKAGLISTPGESLRVSNKRPTGILKLLPQPWVPYAELIRLHKPVGILNIYFPYLFGCLLGACINQDKVTPTRLAATSLQMLLAAFILRSLGCAWNDIIDADVDAETERCKSRPMARGAISTKDAYTFTLALFLVWCWILYQTSNVAAIIHAIPLPFLVALYPFGKRFTSFPQLLLGVTLSLGVFIGAAQMDLSLVGLLYSKEGYDHVWALFSLYMAYVVFALIHDTVYGFQDIKDDKRTGVLSMSVLFANQSNCLFLFLSIIQVGTLVGVGLYENFGIGYYVVACGGNGLLLAMMMLWLDVESAKSCWTWFQAVSLGFGHLVFVGLLWQYAVGV